MEVRGDASRTVVRSFAFVAVLTVSLLFGIGLVMVLADAVTDDAPDVAPIELVTSTTAVPLDPADSTVPDAESTTTTSIAPVATEAIAPTTAPPGPGTQPLVPPPPPPVAPPPAPVPPPVAPPPVDDDDDDEFDDDDELDDDEFDDDD